MSSPQSEATERSIRPDLALWAVVLIWSSTFIAMKDAFRYIDPLAYTAFRFFFINVLAFAVLFIGHARNPAVRIDVDRKDMPRFLLVGLIGYTAYQLGSTLGLDRTTVFTMSLLIAMVPLMTMLILAARREPIPPYGWPGLALAVTGVVVFLQDKRGGQDSVFGMVLVLAAALSFAVYGIINRPLVKAYPTQTTSAYTLLAGTVPLLIVGLPALLDTAWGEIPLRVWIGIGYSIVFPVYIAYQLWNFGIRHRGAAAASGFGLIVPILSGILSAVIYDEHFGAFKLAGAAMVLGGLLILRIQRKPAPVSQPAIATE